MRIIELRAENFKRLKAVSIIPTGNIVEVSGQNSSGKSSTLDAIWAALGGKDAAPTKPIRDGEQAATITLDLGEGSETTLKVTRKFRLKDGVPFATDLIVESGEGARFNSPQGILDGLVGALCFDPLAFTREKPADQLAALRKFVPDVDFAVLEGLNKRDFDTRTDINRRAKELRAQAAALPEVAGEAPDRVDVDALQQKLAEAAEHNSQVEQRRVRRENAEARIAALQDQIGALTKELQALQAQMEGAGPLPDPIDVQEVSAQLTAGRQTNALLDRIGQRTKLEADAKAAEEEAMTLTVAIDKRKDQASKAVRTAKMPIPGLGFGDGFVTLDGQPFEQASHAQQIRASVAIAGAMNPKLRVARIMDGSLLDTNSWAALEEYANENDLQVWVECITGHGPAAVLISDGEVVPAQAADVGDVI